MTKYVLAPVVMTSMLLSIITILCMYPNEPRYTEPLIHVYVMVCICCLVLRELGLFQ